MVIEHVTIKSTPYGRRLDCTLDGREATFWSPLKQAFILCGAACALDTTSAIFDYTKE